MIELQVQTLPVTRKGIDYLESSYDTQVPFRRNCEIEGFCANTVGLWEGIKRRLALLGREQANLVYKSVRYQPQTGNERTLVPPFASLIVYFSPSLAMRGPIVRVPYTETTYDRHKSYQNWIDGSERPVLTCL